jgi:hypothetical protein
MVLQISQRIATVASHTSVEINNEGLEDDRWVDDNPWDVATTSAHALVVADAPALPPELWFRILGMCRLYELGV